MKVNGQDRSLVKPAALTEFLKENGYSLTCIAVELNGEIVKKTEYENIVLKQEDTLEIVRFVGGG